MTAALQPGVEVTIKDGSRVRIRPATTEDVKAIHQYFWRLSLRDRWLRLAKAMPSSRMDLRTVIECATMCVALDASGSVVGEGLYGLGDGPDPFVEMSVARGWR